jgi:hypothetical protein
MVEDRMKLAVLEQTHKILYRHCPDYLFEYATTLYRVSSLSAIEIEQLYLYMAFRQR